MSNEKQVEQLTTYMANLTAQAARIQEYFSSGLNVEQNSHLLMSLRDF